VAGNERGYQVKTGATGRISAIMSQSLQQQSVQVRPKLRPARKKLPRSPSKAQQPLSSSSHSHRREKPEPSSNSSYTSRERFQPNPERTASPAKGYSDRKQHRRDNLKNQQATRGNSRRLQQDTEEGRGATRKDDRHYFRFEYEKEERLSKMCFIVELADEAPSRKYLCSLKQTT